MSQKPAFWEDSTQAQERIAGTYLLHNDSVVYVSGVASAGDDILASLHRYPEAKAESKALSDAGFHRFRKLPPVGWINYLKMKQAVFLSRRPVRARQHGLSNQNVSVATIHSVSFEMNYRDIAYESVAKDAGYAEACRGEYPALDEVLSHIRETSSLAISDTYAVFRDTSGLRWLYRNESRVGIFSGSDSLLLVNKHGYLREELTESPVITVNDIKEF